MPHHVFFESLEAWVAASCNKPVYAMPMQVTRPSGNNGLVMPLDIFLERMQQLAAKEGLTLINCLTADGENDFSVLPALPPELESADEEDEDENEI